jgi:hypothetical protein
MLGPRYDTRTVPTMIALQKSSCESKLIRLARSFLRLRRTG